MSEEAKPKACPWCQQIPRLIFRDDGRIGWRGNCPACKSDKTASPEVMYRAIENWNNRPLEDALVAERDTALARVERLEAALRDIRDLPERKVPFPGTNYENDSARGYADALEDVREIIDRVLGKENT